MAEPSIEGLVRFRELGEGGFAVVYAAHDTVFDRTVAVKVLRRTNADDVRRFARELQHMGKLDQHDAIVTPYRAGLLDDGRPFVVMEHLPGGSLQDVIEHRGPMMHDRATAAVAAIAQALGLVHDVDLLHRDIKPANILLTSEGRPKLSDFGIAVLQSATVTQTAFTALHAAPEVFDGHYDVRSDLWSLASTLFTLIAGQAPFQPPDDGNLLALMGRIHNDPTPALTAAPHLDVFFARALAKSPGARPADADEFVALLGSASPQAQTWQLPAPQSDPDRTRPMPQKPPIVVTVPVAPPEPGPIGGTGVLHFVREHRPLIVALILTAGSTLVAGLLSLARSWYG